MRRVPVSVGGILVDAAPRGVEQTPLLVERLPARCSALASPLRARIIDTPPNPSPRYFLDRIPSFRASRHSRRRNSLRAVPRRRASTPRSREFSAWRRLHRGPGRRIIMIACSIDAISSGARYPCRFTISWPLPSKPPLQASRNPRTDWKDRGANPGPLSQRCSAIEAA